MSRLISPSITFIVLRETLESAIVISVLLSFTSKLIESTPQTIPLIHSPRPSQGPLPPRESAESEESAREETALLLGAPSFSPSTSAVGGAPGAEEFLQAGSRSEEKSLKRKLNTQIIFGAASGFLLSLAIGLGFVIIFYETLAQSFSLTEALWEGVFSLASSVFILLTGLSFVKLDRARVKWRIKLARAFSKSVDKGGKRDGADGRWALWILPFVTVLREGLEGIIFVTGVAISDSPETIPLSVLLGIGSGSILGWALYRSTSRAHMHHFIIFSSSLLFLVGAGLFARGVSRLEAYPFVMHVGGDIAESGSGPGSYDVRGNVFHFNQDWLNPEIKTNGWAMVAAAVVGWSNNGTILSVSAYCLYWGVVTASLVYMKWNEGRLVFGRGGRSVKSKTAETPSREPVEPEYMD